MAVGFSTTNVANKFLDTLRGVSFSNSETWVALHTGDPGAAGTANASAGSTDRSQVSFSAASGGALALTGAQPSWTNGGTSETITHLSVWSASSGGSFLFSVALGTSRAWVSGDVLAVSALGVSITSLAS